MSNTQENKTDETFYSCILRIILETFLSLKSQQKIKKIQFYYLVPFKKSNLYMIWMSDLDIE